MDITFAGVLERDASNFPESDLLLEADVDDEAAVVAASHADVGGLLAVRHGTHFDCLALRSSVGVELRGPE